MELKSMYSTDFAQDKAELDAFFTRLEAEGYRDCIVDIRRNGGGSSPYGIDAIVVPNSTRVQAGTHY
ncbi:MAG: S41 family peptidase, partial [Oscillospiraceae bacterium]